MGDIAVRIRSSPSTMNSKMGKGDTKADANWIAKMLVSSIALSVLLATIACVTPPLVLHYKALCYRHACRSRLIRYTEDDHGVLDILTQLLLSSHASLVETEHLLGPPVVRAKHSDGTERLFYMHPPVRRDLACKGWEEEGKTLVFRGGQLALVLPESSLPQGVWIDPCRWDLAETPAE